MVVANAPQSNVITAAEHTIALLLALARRVPQAHASLIGGAWERSSFSGVELYEKTLGILGFGRIGQLVAQRARGFGMRVLAFDAYVAEERFRELGARAGRQLGRRLRRGRLHHRAPPRRQPETRELAGRRGLREDEGRRARAQRGARLPLLVDEDLKAAIDSGKVRAPRSTCSARSLSPIIRCSAIRTSS